MLRLGVWSSLVFKMFLWYFLSLFGKYLEAPFWFVLFVFPLWCYWEKQTCFKTLFNSGEKLWIVSINIIFFLPCLCVCLYTCVCMYSCVCACMCMLCAYVHVTLWVQAALRSNGNHASLLRGSLVLLSIKTRSFPGFKLPVRLCCLARRPYTYGYHCLFHNENSSTGYYT